MGRLGNIDGEKVKDTPSFFVAEIVDGLRGVDSIRENVDVEEMKSKPVGKVVNRFWRQTGAINFEW